MKKLLLLLCVPLLLTAAGCLNRDRTDGSEPVTALHSQEPDDPSDCPTHNTVSEPQTEAVTEPQTDATPKILHRPEVLMYHAVSDNIWSPYSNLFVSPAELHRQIIALQQAGYTFLFADEYADYTQRTVILTVDDGYDDNFDYLFPILRETGAVATVFVIKNMVGQEHYLTEDEIREMAQSGLVRFGCHTSTHSDLTTLGTEQVQRELVDCRAYLEGLTGTMCRSMAYPSGRYNDTVVALTRNYFAFAYTTDGPAHFRKSGLNPMLIPRHYIVRDTTVKQMLEMID